MKKKAPLKAAIVSGAIAIIIIGLFFLIAGDRVFGGFLMLAGIVELVMVPVLLKKMEDMNR